jgi:hypothetical protein
VDASTAGNRTRRVVGGALAALAALSVGVGAATAERDVVAPVEGRAFAAGDLPPTIDEAITATLDTGITGIGAGRVHHELGVTGAGQTIAVFDAGFDLAAIDAVSPGPVGLLGNFSRDVPYSNTQSGVCPRHGTEVAVRAAVTAPAATIVPVVIRGRSDCNMRITEDAVRWALGLPVAGVQSNPTPATVLAWSFGALTPYASPDELCPLVTKAIAWGAVVVASAGNDATDRANDFFPGACGGALMIGNSGAAGIREIDGGGFGSNLGSRVDLLAPATSTSFAVPFAAGAVALARATKPSMTAAEAATVVRDHTQPFPVPCSGCGTGILDAYGAVSALTGASAGTRQTVELPEPTTPPLGFRPVVPARLVDTRAPAGGGRLQQGELRPVQVAGAGGVPTRAQGGADPTGVARAAILNITATGSDAEGYLTAFPCDAPLPATSSVNVGAGGTAAAAVTVQLDASGRVCVFSATSVDLVIDVAGYFTTDAAAFTYVADQATPRVLDTRGRTPAVPGQAPLVVPIDGAAEGDAVTVNVTAIGQSGAGWVALTPCGAASAGAVSNVNVDGGDTVPNQATVRLGTGGALCVVAGEAVIDVLIDVQGRWRAGEGARFVPIAPTRVVDSRVSIGVDDPDPIAPGTPVAYPVTAGGPVALAATVTATGSTRGGYFQVSPCDADRIAANPSSALNIDGGDAARANGVYDPIDPASHSTCITAGPTPGTPLAHVILDITGWFTTE